MKDQVARTLVCLVLGALACHVKVLGCYPLVAIIFGAFYLEEENRRVCAFFLFMDGIVFADCIVVSLWHSFFGMDGGAFHFLAYARCSAPFWTGSNAWDDSCGGFIWRSGDDGGTAHTRAMDFYSTTRRHAGSGRNVRCSMGAWYM